MLKIRLSRTGKRSQPSYRIIVQEHTAAVKGGKVVENLGTYFPTKNPKVFTVDTDRVKHWITLGAKPSDTIAVLLKKNGMEGMEKYIEPRNKKRINKKAPKIEPAAQATPEAKAPEVKTEAAPEATVTPAA